MSALKLKAFPLMMVLILVGVGACRPNTNQASERIAEDTSNAKTSERNNFTFNNVTLEQADEQGQTLWKVEAEQATYSEDQRIAEVTNPRGELFQDGEPIFRVKAQTGEVRQDGERIFLKGNIEATDLRSGAILRGNELEWRPKDSLLKVSGDLRGTHPKLVATAEQAQVSTREQQMELSGDVVATTREPNLRMRTDRLVWQMENEKILSDRPVQVQRLENNRPTDEATGETAEVNLATQTATLLQNAQLNLNRPPVQLTSDSITWDLANQIVTANQPLDAVHRQQRITMTAGRGRMDLNQQIFYLSQNVRAVGRRNDSVLTANNLTWNIDSEEVVAEGNVAYQQAEPPLSLSGPRAVGKLEEETIVVSGGRVVTEIIPE